MYKTFGALLIREGCGKSDRRILAIENGKFSAMMRFRYKTQLSPEWVFNTCQSERGAGLDERIART